MKAIFIAIALILPQVSAAQKVSDFRIVDGQLYNVQKSIKWVDMPPADSFGKSEGTFNHSSYRGKVEAVGSNWVTVRITLDTERGPAYGSEWYDRIVYIKNHPQTATFTTGDVFPRAKLFPIGTKILKNAAGGQVTVRAYDYGLPNTPENRRTLAKPTP